MADTKPPRLEGGERETLQLLLDYQRRSFLAKVADLSDADARRELVPSGTTLLWLLKHLARAEELWIVHRFAGQPMELDDDSVGPDDSVAASVHVYRDTWSRVDAVIGAASLDDPCRNLGNDAPVNLRWVLAHLLEETARHAGHADILRELIDGSTGR